MKRRRRVEITVETERVFAVALPRRTPLVWCEGCGAEIEMLTVSDAAARARVGTETICAWASTGELHTHVMPEGALLVCAATLSRRYRAG